METIRTAATSAVNTASTYIYGNAPPTDSGIEPISGERGKGTAEDPYDAGNKETEELTGSEPKKSVTTELPSSAPTSAAPTSATPTTAPTGAPTSAPTNPHSSTFGAPDASTGADVSSAQQPESKHQGGNRPTELPNEEQAGAVKETKDEGEEALKKRDPNDHSGEPMHMHDGSDKPETSQEEEEHPGQEGGTKHGEKGSGEEWIKTSGLKADGGDFDAAKPGAGREADRLLEEKGITKDDRGGMITKDGEPVHGSGKTDHNNTEHKTSEHSKVKTIDKIKEKLHIGKH